MVEDRALFAEQMVGIVSHDLRNPLSAILMGARLLHHGETDPKRLQTLDRVSTSARRAQRLIEDLLDFTLARVGPGLSVHREPLDLHGLVFGAVDEFQLGSPDVVVVHHRVGSGACTADADRVAQLLGNLLQNAITYGTPGTDITVTSEVSIEAATISVHNWGPPIPQDLLPTLFDPMVRGRSTGHSERSVGLGLFIVRAIALAHGGKVGVTSSQDEGTTFSFSFPVL
jgi:sigma-B regulation protein RsbU (phosphoserine phosphatase)